MTTVHSAEQLRPRPPPSPHGACSPTLMAASMGIAVVAIVISYLYMRTSGADEEELMNE